MTKLAAKLTSQFLASLLIAAAALFIVAAAGAWGLNQTHWAAHKLYSDQLRTVDATASLGQELDDSYESAQDILLVSTPALRQQLTDHLFQDLVPQVDTSLANLRLIHQGDPHDQVALVQQLEHDWARFQKMWNTRSLLATEPRTAMVSAQLDSVFLPLEGVTDRLLVIEYREASLDRDLGDSAFHTSLVLIGAALAIELFLGGLLGWLAARRVVPRALAPAEAQDKFAEAMQFTNDEKEAHRLLQRYLERSISGSHVVVLSGDGATSGPETAELAPSLVPVADALKRREGILCVAARTATAHKEAGDPNELVSCPICVGCPGVSVCTPLAIGGRVVGSVLVNRTKSFDTDDERCIRDSILRAAPVLANLRNLATAEAEAATDSLTGLPNKGSIETTLRQMVAQAQRASTMLGVLAADLDHFKAVNDTYGHGRGDAVLAAVGAALRSTLRTADVAGRNGGEEFLVLLPSTDDAGACDAAKRVRAAIARIHIPGVDSPLTLSIGVAVYPLHSGDADGVLRSADSALYQAKANGRNCVKLASVPDPLLPPPVAIGPTD